MHIPSYDIRHRLASKRKRKTPAYVEGDDPWEFNRKKGTYRNESQKRTDAKLRKEHRRGYPASFIRFEDCL